MALCQHQPTGTLSVCKVVIDNTGFGLKPSDFTFAFTSEGADPAEFPGSADCTEVTVPEGPYSFGETPIREFPFSTYYNSIREILAKLFRMVSTFSR